MPLRTDRTITLINPLYREKWEYVEDNPYAVLPLGILSIGTVLSEKGYSVKIIDACTNPNYFKDIEAVIDDSPLFIGISTMTAQLPSALNIVRLISRKDVLRRIPIVWGGIHPTIFPEMTARNSAADIVVIGRGEHTSLKLAEELSCVGKPELRSIPGIAFYDNGKFIQTSPAEYVDINNLPYINYELLDIHKYIHRNIGYGSESKMRSLILYTGSGCPFRCTFCASVALHNRRYSGKTAQRILDEIDFFTNKYNVEYISFCDELFFVNKKRIQEFLDGLAKRSYRIQWYANIRADCFKPDFLSEDMISKMKQLGCNRLGMGVESGSQRVLDEIIKKDIKLEYVFEAARLCSKYDIMVGYSFMMGLPGETKSDILKTLSLMKKIKQLHHKCFFFGPQVYRPFPGSELYKQAVRLGFNDPEDLEGWAKIEHSKSLQCKLSGEYSWSGFDPSDFPWVKQAGLIRHIDFLQHYLFRDLKSMKIDLRYPIKVMLVLIARFRVKFEFWYLPIEYWLYRFFVITLQFRKA